MTNESCWQKRTINYLNYLINDELILYITYITILQ